VPCGFVAYDRGITDHRLDAGFSEIRIGIRGYISRSLRDLFGVPRRDNRAY
jgi:hypothetical protein